MDTNTVNAATAAAGEPAVQEQVMDLAVNWGFRIVGFLLIIIIGMWVAKLIKGLVVKSMEKKNVDPTLTKFMAALIHMGLKVFVVIAALGQLNVQTASFVAILGAAGLAVGLALQGSLSNFASGVLMIIFKPIAIGDFVEAGGAMGGVEEIGIFTTILKSPDNKKLIVPNSAVMGGVITNFNANGTRRIEIIAGISYDDDIDQAKKILEEIVSADERILKDPAPQIAMSEMADSSVNFVVRPWVEPANYWGVYFDTMEAIKKRFDENSISIPYPQRDVHIYEHKEG